MGKQFVVFSTVFLSHAANAQNESRWYRKRCTTAKKAHCRHLGTKKIEWS